eukprot:TRINITY_DN1353_c0_g1_i2.p2 TRINITY_DN1353_c0_g1~~TRINITY_DN1353_c0_g1_i2.p2  ORF type:complete len:140 (-),score=25.26 TRINITY_DN1353_c0_g1_i2:328-747(-)
MMKMFAICAAVAAMLAIQCHATGTNNTANIASATSTSTAGVFGDYAFANTNDNTFVQGDGYALADGYAVAVTPTCLVVANTDAVSVVAEHCGIIIADTFADAFAVGQFPFAVVNSWAVANDIECSAFADADAFASAFGC